MKKLFAKIKEYVKMTEELSFNEFSEYYQEVISFLQSEYQDLNEEDLLKAQGICGIISSNAQARAAKKDSNRKKFQKMGEKAGFWEGSIKMRLAKSGLSPAEIDKKQAELWQEDNDNAPSLNED